MPEDWEQYAVKPTTSTTQSTGEDWDKYAVKKKVDTKEPKPIGNNLQGGAATQKPTSTPSQLGVPSFNELVLGSKDYKPQEVQPTTDEQLSNFNEQTKKMLGGAATLHTENGINKPQEPLDKEAALAFQQQRGEDTKKHIKQAIENTANYKIVKQARSKGYLDKEPSKDEMDVEKGILESKLKSGDLVLTKDAEGNPALSKPRGFWDSFFNTLNHSIDDPIDAYDYHKAVVKGDVSELVRLKDAEKEKQGRIPESIDNGSGMNFAGGLVGGLPKMGVEIAAGGGNPAGIAAVFGTEATYTGLKHNTDRLYEEILAKDPSVSKEEAMQKALSTATHEMPVDFISNAALGYVGGESKGLFGALGSKAPEQTAKSVFVDALKNTSKGAAAFGAVQGGGELAKTGVEDYNGFERKLGDYVSNTLSGAKDGALVKLAFDLVHVGSDVYKNAPKYLRATAKEYLVTQPQSVVDYNLGLMGEKGKEIKQSLDEYRDVREQFKGLVPDEQIGTFANWQQKINSLTEENKQLGAKKSLNTAVHPQIDKLIDANNEEIKGINKKLDKYKKTNNISEFDTDTGLPLNETAQKIADEKTDNATNQTKVVDRKAELHSMDDVIEEKQRLDDVVKSEEDWVKEKNSKTSKFRKGLDWIAGVTYDGYLNNLKERKSLLDKDPIAYFEKRLAQQIEYNKETPNSSFENNIEYYKNVIEKLKNKLNEPIEEPIATKQTSNAATDIHVEQPSEQKEMPTVTIGGESGKKEVEIKPGVSVELPSEVERQKITPNEPITTEKGVEEITTVPIEAEKIGSTETEVDKATQPTAEVKVEEPNVSSNKYQDWLERATPMFEHRQRGIDPESLTKSANKLMDEMLADEEFMKQFSPNERNKTFLMNGLSGSRGELENTLKFLVKENKAKEQPKPTEQNTNEVVETPKAETKATPIVEETEKSELDNLKKKLNSNDVIDATTTTINIDKEIAKNNEIIKNGSALDKSFARMANKDLLQAKSMGKKEYQKTDTPPKGYSLVTIGKKEYFVSKEKYIPTEQKAESKPIVEEQKVEGKREDYVAKNGRSKIVYDEKGNFEVINTTTGKKVDRKTERKIISEAADAYDFSKGKRAEIPKDAILKDEKEVENYIIDNSTSPSEIAEVYAHQQLEQKNNFNTQEQIIVDMGIGRVDEKSFRRFGDRNNKTGDMQFTYFHPKGNAEPRSLEDIAQEMTHQNEWNDQHIEITPQDIADFMTKYPKGVYDAAKLVETEIAYRAKEKFQQLTGLPLNKETATKAIDYEFNKLTSEQQKFAEQQFNDRQQLEDAYWAEQNGTNNAAKKGDIGEVKQTKPTRESEPIADKERTIDVAKILKDKTIFDKNVATDIASKLEGFADWLHNMDKGKLQSSLLAIPKAILEEASKGAAKILRTTNDLAKAIDHFIDKVKDHYEGTDLRDETEKLFGKYFGEKNENIGDKTPPINSSGDSSEADGIYSNGKPLTKAQQSEYESAKKVFEAREGTTWNDITSEALAELTASKPSGVSLYDAAMAHANELAARYDKDPTSYNPIAKDLAKLEYAFTVTTDKIDEVKKSLSSDDAIVQDAALVEIGNLNKAIQTIAKASFVSEAGTAFGIRQMAFKLKNGLEIRRAELRDKTGKPLSNEDIKFTREQWEKEKEVLQKIHDLKVKDLNTKFEQELKDYKEKLDKANKAAQGSSFTDKAKSAANNFRKLKTKPFTFKDENGNDIPIAVQGLTWNDMVEIGAKAIEKTGEIADGVAAIIDKISDNDWYKNLSNEDKKKFETQVKSHFKIEKTAEDERVDATNKINELKGEGNAATKEMAKPIRDFVNSYAGEVELDQVADVAFHQLKEILPNITKEQMKDAYRGVGDFKQDTEKKLKSERDIAKNDLRTLTGVEAELAQLGKLKDKLGEENPNKVGVINEKIAKAREKVKSVIRDMGRKLSNDNEVKKEQYQSRAESHKKQIDTEFGKLTQLADNTSMEQHESNALYKAIDDVNNATVDYEPNSKLNQDVKFKEAIDKLDVISNNLDDLPINSKEAKNLKLAIQNSIDNLKYKFNEAKDVAEQKIMLSNAKKTKQQTINETERKINAKEYAPESIKKPLTESEAELVKLNIQKNIIESAYRKRADAYRKANVGKLERTAEFSRNAFVNWIISGSGTLWNVAIASPYRFIYESLGRLGFGKLAEAYTNKNIVNRAREGGESSSNEAIAALTKAIFTHKNEAEIAKVKKAYAKDYEKIANKIESIDAEIAKDGENKSALEQEKKDLQKELNKSLIRLIRTSGFDFIGGKTLKTSWDALQHGSTDFEEAHGEYLKQERLWKGFFKAKNQEAKNTLRTYNGILDAIEHELNYVGRSHKAFKSIAARAFFLSSFTARLEAALENGKDIQDYDVISQLATESINQWDEGAYQNKNAITTAFNEIVTKLKGSKNLLVKGIGWALSFKNPITKVPVNIAIEATTECLVGSVTSPLVLAREYVKANKVASMETNLRLSDLSYFKATKEEQAQYKEAVNEALGKMDLKTAAYIMKAARKGNTSLAIAMLAIAAGTQFGGFSNINSKKQDEKKGADDVKTNDVKLKNGIVLYHFITKSLLHNSAMMNYFVYSNMINDFNKGNALGIPIANTTIKATYNVFEHLVGQVPQIKGFGIDTEKILHKSFSSAEKQTERVLGSYGIDIKNIKSNTAQEYIKDELKQYYDKQSNKLQGNPISKNDDKDLLMNYKKNKEHTPVPATRAEMVNYNEVHQKELLRRLKNFDEIGVPILETEGKNEGDVVIKKFAEILSKDEKDKQVKKIKTAVTNQVKLKLFGIKDKSDEDNQNKQDLKNANEDYNDKYGNEFSKKDDE